MRKVSMNNGVMNSTIKSILGVLALVLINQWTVTEIANNSQVAKLGIHPPQLHYQPSIPKAVHKKPAAAYDRQAFHLAKRLPAGSDHLPIDPYRQALETMADQATFSTRQRRFLNQQEKNQSTPSIKLQTGWEWLGPGNVGGRTRALLFHPENPAVMFAAGVSGGIWKSTNAGSSWQPLADNMANINVGALAIDPINPDTLYAGTGELYRKTLRPYSSMSGAGIFKSTDGGLTWFQLTATVSNDFMYVSDVVISPHNNQRMYAATNTGVWRSDDGGITFNHTLNPSDGQGNPLYEGCNDLSMRSDVDDDWLLVSCASRSTDDRYYLPGLLPTACNGPCDARVYLNQAAQHSDDWEVVLTEPGMGRTEMAIHQANQNIIYASSVNTNGGPDLNNDGQPDLDNGLHAIFRSDDGGQSWRAQLRNTSNDLLSTQLFSYAEGALARSCDPNGSVWYYSAGWYNQAIAVNPLDPNQVWVAGMEIYRSDDGGQSFGLASHWDALFFNNPDYNGAYVHADQHALIFHPDYDGDNNKTMYAINDGGMFLTEDDSAPVQTGTDAACEPVADGVQWQSINHNYGTTQFYAGAVFANGRSYMAGAQDNGTVYGSDSLGANGWFAVGGGDGGDLAINPADDSNFYIASQNANIFRTNDFGSSYTSIRPPIVPGSAIFITPYEIDPNNHERLFLGADRLWRSDDRGSTWQTSSPPTGNTYNDLISALAVAPGNSNQVLYANQSAIIRINNALDGSNLYQTTVKRPRQGWVSSLAYDPNDANVAYATYSTFGGNHVWKTTNAGITWLPIDGDGPGQLPDVPVHKLVVDPNDGDRLYIGTDLGVFVTLDGGQNWAVENTGFSQVITEDLVIRTTPSGEPMLFAFTYGRGVWRGPLSDLDAAPDYSVTDDVSGNWYNPAQSGHGLQLEVIELGGQPAMLAAWYVFHQGQPIWLIGVGELTDNTVTIDMNITSNTGFPVAEFNGDDIEQTYWGTVKLVLDTDRTGQLIWSSVLPDFNNGSMQVERLTQLAVPPEPGSTGLNVCHSGSWYDPGQDGHGFMVDIIQTGTGQNMLLTWYTYHNGEQFWLLANGPIDGDTATVTALSGSGANFPTEFDPNDVVFTEWGEITFTRVDDNNAEISWVSIQPGFPDASIDVTRLTQLRGFGCQ